MSDPWELSDQELRHIVCHCNVVDHTLDEYHSDKMCKECYEHGETLAHAAGVRALEWVHAWGMELCEHEPKDNDSHTLRRNCPYCWSALNVGRKP